MIRCSSHVTATCNVPRTLAIVVTVLALGAAILWTAGCAPSCEELSGSTQRELEALSTACSTDADCRAVNAVLLIELVGAPLCAAPCGLVVRADVDDATVRTQFGPIADDEEGCECGRPRCGVVTAVCEANRCVGSL